MIRRLLSLGSWRADGKAETRDADQSGDATTWLTGDTMRQHFLVLGPTYDSMLGRPGSDQENGRKG